jgi:hypothetical protein
MLTKRRFPARRALALLAMAAPCAVIGTLAVTAAGTSVKTVNAQRQQSENWAGYIVYSKTGENFSSVSGSWTQPSVAVSSGRGYSAFWVGLGGASPQSQAVEQIGTSANVVKGRTQYSAWYELIPAPETDLNIAVHPGDHISARVAVSGTNVTLSLSDQTTGQSASKTLPMSNPDTSSAEWIAEAPSAQTQTGGSQILPLANFGTVTFTNASATAGGHTGSISDPNWTVQEAQLSPSGGIGFPGAGSIMPGFPGQPTQSSAGATPSGLSDGGTSFSVSYSAAGGSQPSARGARRAHAGRASCVETTGDNGFTPGFTLLAGKWTRRADGDLQRTHDRGRAAGNHVCVGARRAAGAARGFR